MRAHAQAARSARIGMVLVALALGACAPRPQLLEAHAPAPRALDQGWSRHLDDAPADAWTPVELGARRAAESLHRSASFRVVLPAGDWDEPALFFGAIDTDFEATLDGAPLARSAAGSATGRVSLGAPWRLLRLPRDFAGKTLTLHATSENPFELGPEPPVWLGARSDLLQAMLGQGLVRTLIGLLAFAMGLIGVGLFVVRPCDRFHLAFGLFALAQGVGTVAVAEAKQLVLDAPLFWWVALTAARLVAPVALLAFVELTAPTPRPWLRRLWQAMAVGAVLVALALAVELRTYQVLWRAVNLEALLGLAVVLVVAGSDAFRRRIEAVLVLLGVLLFVGSSLHDSFAAVHLLSATPPWGPLGLLGLLLGLGAVEVNRLTQVYRTLAGSVAELERKNALLTAAGLELQAAIQVRDDFLSVASHELRTPVSALVLQMDLLAHPARAEKAKAAMQRQLERLQQLIFRLLDVSRIQGRRLVLDLEEVDLARIAREAVERTREAQEPHPAITFEGEESLSGRWDRVRLEQVVVNLISNAIKYGEQKPVRVRVARGGLGAVLAVTDQGMGISDADQARIFQRFERAVNARNIAGLGLGLWITRAIVRELGGTVTLVSAPRAGSTFQVELPLAGPAPSSTQL
jgi:signal transduction histidine kinase